MECFDSFIPKDWKIYCHHMTIRFGDIKETDDDDLVRFIKENEGKEFNMKLISFGESDKAMAVQVETDCPSKNEIKHITIAVSQNGKPYDSNKIVNWRKINKEILIKGTLTNILQ